MKSIQRIVTVGVLIAALALPVAAFGAEGTPQRGGGSQQIVTFGAGIIWPKPER